MIGQIAVLVVDDDEVDRLTYDRYLSKSKLNICVSYACTAKEAISKCLNEIPDCILLDYNLPDMNGIDCLRELQKNKTLLDVPIIIFTGNGAEETAVNAMKLGAKDYLVKNTISTQLLEETILNSIKKAKIDVEEKQKQEKINQLAYQDELTQLLKRHSFIDMLDKKISNAKRNNYEIAVMFIDIDNFKEINDTFGHQKGDWLLKNIATNINRITRKDDFVCRYGGDEFVLCLSHVDDIENVKIVAKKLIKSICDLKVFGSQGICVGASIGIALYPLAGDSAEQLIEHADKAMYLAKESKNTYYFYMPNAIYHNQCTNGLEQIVETQINAQNIELAYQPLYSVDDYSIIGIEAYLRMDDSDNAALPTEHVIQAAIKTGRILDLANIIHEKAIRDLCWLREKSQNNFPILTFNVAPIELYDEQMVYHLFNLASKYNIDPSTIEIELNKQVCDGIDKSIDIIKMFKRLGFRLSVDNFGVGGVSLDCLKLIKPNSICIDHSFISNIDADNYEINIAKSIIDIGKNLNIDVVAKRIETSRQDEILTKLGYQLVQGFLYSVPVGIEQIYQLCANRNSNSKLM